MQQKNTWAKKPAAEKACNATKGNKNTLKTTEETRKMKKDSIYSAQHTHKSHGQREATTKGGPCTCVGHVQCLPTAHPVGAVAYSGRALRDGREGNAPQPLGTPNLDRIIAPWTSPPILQVTFRRFRLETRKEGKRKTSSIYSVISVKSAHTRQYNNRDAR